MFRFFILRAFGLSCILFSTCSIQPSDQKAKIKKFTLQLGIGSIAGITESLVNQPTVVIKNLFQGAGSSNQRSQTLLNLIKSMSIKDLYRGLGSNLVSMVPTTALQLGTDDALKSVFPGSDLYSAIIRNGLTGFISPIACNGTELLNINQLKDKAGPKETAIKLYKNNGAFVFFRGYLPKAMRDSKFCAGFLTFYPKLRDYLKEKSGNNALSTVGSASIVGPITAAASHPYDAISTAMQADPSGKRIKGFVSAGKLIYEQYGIQGFFAGYTPRALRIMVAIPLMSWVSNYLSKFTK